MAQADPPVSSSAPGTPHPEPSSPTSRWPAVLALALGAVVVARVGPKVWAEYRALRRAWDDEGMTRPVGYPNITPRPSLAAKPAEWARDEGASTLLWSGWDPAAHRHGWFRIGRGEIATARLAGVLGRDVVRAIDRPIVEVGGGTFWERIPPGHPVVALSWAGVEAAYPLRVLEKVEVVNDVINDSPLLVVFTPFVPVEQAVATFDPHLAGRRVTLGSSGYFLDRRPLLYDRETESLWLVRDDGVTAVAGRRKGETLRRAGDISLCSWAECRDQHPRCRLVVGADRSGGIPVQ